MKKKVLLSAILSIVLCLSLIAGSTFALFTSETNLALEVLVNTCDNLHQGRLTRAVKTDDTDLRTIEE